MVWWWLRLIDVIDVNVGSLLQKGIAIRNLFYDHLFAVCAFVNVLDS